MIAVTSLSSLLLLLLLQCTDAFQLHTATSTTLFTKTKSAISLRQRLLLNMVGSRVSSRRVGGDSSGGRKRSSSPSSTRKPFGSATSSTKSNGNYKGGKPKPSSVKSIKVSRAPKRKAKEVGVVTPTLAAPATLPKGKILTAQNILGQNVVTCRNFRLDSTKIFSFLGSYNSLSAMPAYATPEIAFVGRSNVGKSSLLNAISGLNKAIAVEGKQPGRTQLMNQFLCHDEDGEICIFTDLPGYGFAKISKDLQEQISQFVNDYLRHRGALKLTCLLVDARREPQEADLKMIEFLNQVGGHYLVIATKVDKLSKNEVDVSMKRLREAFQLPDEMPIRFSAVTGDGKRQVWHMIKDAMLDQGIFTMEEGSDDDEDDYDDDDDDEEGYDEDYDDSEDEDE